MKKPAALHVRPGKMMVISGVDLQDGDRFVLHRVIDSECTIEDARDIPFSPCGQVLFLDCTHNPVAVDMPGRYRIYPDGIISPTADLWFDEIDTGN